MININFNYSGIINESPIIGNGTLNANPSDGNFLANVEFSSFPESFDIAASGFSLLSISCSNGAKAMDTAQNIFDLTRGVYSSIREIEISDPLTGKFLGHIIINGAFRKTAEDLLDANVVVSGNYSGPIGLLFPNGYTLPMVAENKFMLEGMFTKEYTSEEGRTIKTVNRHRYFFDNGVTSPLRDIIALLSYDVSESYWRPEERRLRLVGESIIKPFDGIRINM